MYRLPPFFGAVPTLDQIRRHPLSAAPAEASRLIRLNHRTLEGTRGAGALPFQVHSGAAVGAARHLPSFFRSAAMCSSAALNAAVATECPQRPQTLSDNVTPAA